MSSVIFNNREHFAKRDANLVLVNNQLVINNHVSSSSGGFHLPDDDFLLPCNKPKKESFNEYKI